MLIFALLSASALAVLAMWSHRRNVDRICTSLERQARSGHPVANVDRVLLAALPPAVTSPLRWITRGRHST